VIAVTAGRHRTLLPHVLALLYGLAIVFASLQPFSPWIAPEHDTPFWPFAPWPLLFTRYDLIANVVAYVPFGGFVAELYPASVRATGQGTSYNIGRMAGAIAPYTIGLIATLPGIGIGLALSVTSAFFLLAAALVFTLPNRSGQALDE